MKLNTCPKCQQAVIIKSGVSLRRIEWLFIVLFIFSLGSCSVKDAAVKSGENFRGIGFVGFHPTIKVSETSKMEIPAFSTFLFQYHDSIFEIQLDPIGKSTCYWVNLPVKRKMIVDSFLNLMGSPGHEVPLKVLKGNCFGQLVYLTSKNGKSEFSGLPSRYDGLFVVCASSSKKEIPASRCPGIFEAKMYEFDARFLRHYFSDAYYYKDFRITSEVTFEN